MRILPLDQGHRHFPEISRVSDCEGWLNKFQEKNGLDNRICDKKQDTEVGGTLQRRQGWKARGTLAEGTPLPEAGNPANLKAFVCGESSTREAFSLGVEES